MKFIISLAVIFLLSLTISCNKEQCTDVPIPSACNDTVPSNELCAAVFTRWFYNKSTKACNEVTYSGCSQKGFANKEECEACK